MPTYEYQCTECEKVFEEFQSITAKPMKKLKVGCDQCDHKAPVKRLIGTGAALLFKGDGFYETDYRSESYKKAAKAESESSSKSSTDAKSDKKSDTKSDTSKKTDAKSSKKKSSSD